jgi:hypothetical protein
MSEFAFLFRGREIPASPEQAQRTMAKWVAWMKELKEKGYLKNPGNPLDDAGKVVKGKRKVINDGPYAEAKDIVNGHMLIEADDLAHATSLATGCPILEADGSVEVRPVRQLTM